MELSDVVTDIADAVVEIDGSGKPFKSFQVGAGKSPTAHKNQDRWLELKTVIKELDARPKAA